MPVYRVRAGHTFGAFDQHTAGALVEMTEREAIPFFDKLELAEEGAASPEEVKPEPEEVKPDEAKPEPEPEEVKPERKRKAAQE